MVYLTTLTRPLPSGKVLVHNRVKGTRRLGSRGFRAWLSKPDPTRLTVCRCGWARDFGPHYRVK